MAACFADLPSKRWLDRNAHGGVTELLANCVKHSSNGGQYITTVHCLAFDHPVVFFLISLADTCLIWGHQ